MTEENSLTENEFEAAARAIPSGRGLLRGHFRRVAEGGFGDGQNAYAHSCAWFDGKLYVGTTRYVLPLFKAFRAQEMPLDPFPVPPVKYPDMDMRAQLWRYDPDTEEWQLAFRAPIVEGTTGEMVAKANSFRNMLVYQGKSDPKPALYTIPNQNKRVADRVMLRTYDGINFDDMPQPLLPGEDSWSSFRGLVEFKGKMFAAPASQHVKFDPNKGPSETTDDDQVANVATGSSIRFTDDPASGVWYPSSLPDMGDPANSNIFDLGVCGEYLYAGTLNIRDGFQLWRTDAEGPGPHHWVKIMDRGADRGPLNQSVLSFAEFRGDLYVGTCIQNGGYDSLNGVGPAGAEILRVRPDGSWDMIVGDPRKTRDGFKSPTSGIGAGFGTLMNGYFWRMVVHEGALYMGTAKQVAVWQYSDRSNWPEAIQRIVDDDTMEMILEQRGGCELWRTTDGDNWIPVTINGFENRYNMGIRTFASTPRGLFVGTANFYGPAIAINHPTGWRYEPNPRGGLEIWHGSFEHSEEASTSRDIEDSNPPARRMVATDELATSMRVADLAVVDHPLSRVDFEVDSLLRSARLRANNDLDPIIRQSIVGGELPKDDEVDSLLKEYFGSESNHNVGYWYEHSPNLAALQLVNELVHWSFQDSENANLSESESVPTNPLSCLIIGASSPAFVARLSEISGDSQLTAWVPSRDIADRIQRTESSVTVSVVSDIALQFANRNFDRIFWIEGPDLNNSSLAFRSLYRLLKPSGELFASNFLYLTKGNEVVEEEIAALNETLRKSGFSDSTIIDVTDKTWLPFHRHSRRTLFSKALSGICSFDTAEEVFLQLPGGNRAVGGYLLIKACKETQA